MAAAAAGLIEAAFDELADRWKPILDIFEANGQQLRFEVHPGEDIFDGETFEMFLERVKGHKACHILYDPSHFVSAAARLPRRTSTSTKTASRCSM